jgi:hypothetical protein
MIISFPYSRAPFHDLLASRRAALVAASEAASDAERVAREAFIARPGFDTRYRLSVARLACRRAYRVEEARDSVSLAVRALLVAAYLLPETKLPPYGVLAEKGAEKAAASTVSLSPCEPVYAVLRRRMGALRLHNLVDHLLAVPPVVGMAHALMRLPPDEHERAVREAVALAEGELSECPVSDEEPATREIL